MTLLDTEKRPRGLRALSALKAKSHRKKTSDPPSPQDDAVDVPDYLAADAIPSIPSNKKLPQPPPVHSISRREVPGPPPPTAMRNGPMPMDRMPNNNSSTMPVNPIPAPRPPPSDIPAPAEPPAKPLRSPAAPMGPPQMPMNQVPRGAVHTSTVPHSPKPIRPPSTPVVEHIPSDGPPVKLANGGDTAAAAAAADGLMHEPDTDNAATPVAYRAPEADNSEEEKDDEPGPLPEERPESATPLPLLPPDVPAVAAPLADIHFNCYQEHRAMPIANNVWYPVPCMACHKHDRDIRHRCVFCCLRVCNACFQVLQRCQGRSLGELLEGIQE
ncbi:hypothetical protein PHISP_07727 [Aspergillus sp. HF37]|nr:hypothetical protein PHISP_07727 [Aspergillus sp. HF37]